MDYKQHLASALLALGSGDEAGALKALDAAEAEAASHDPEGPRVAEVCNYRAQCLMQMQRLAEARASLERVAAIWERFPELSEGLEDYYLQLMGLSQQLDEPAAAEAWQAKAKAAHARRQSKPWR